MGEGGESLTVRKTMTFLFDYGDEWQFRVEVLALGERQPRKRYPGMVALVGKAPP